MVFNVLATNYDDHTKNFSFILKKDSRWELAPAYDLCFAYDEKSLWVSKQTLSVNGKRQDITFEDMMTIAKDIGAKNAKSIIEEVLETVREWKKYAEQAKIREDLTAHIDRNLNAHKFQLP
jgi:serine/threonine-protein kinase HipA